MQEFEFQLDLYNILRTEYIYTIIHVIETKILVQSFNTGLISFELKLLELK